MGTVYLLFSRPWAGPFLNTILIFTTALQDRYYYLYSLSTPTEFQGGWSDLLKVIKLSNWCSHNSNQPWVLSHVAFSHPASQLDHTALLFKGQSSLKFFFFSFSQCNAIPRGQIAFAAWLHEREVDPSVLRCTGEASPTPPWHVLLFMSGRTRKSGGGLLPSLFRIVAYNPISGVTGKYQRNSKRDFSCLSAC